MRYYITLALTFCMTSLFGHCQMPCGIYHDAMVFDQIDQYVETMVKAMHELNHVNTRNVKDHNTFVRWVMEKEKASNDMAHLMNAYFLQQKIKPDEPDTVKRLTSAHKLLFLMVAIKQNVDVKIVDEFSDEWDKFKLMFHVVDYECKVERLRRSKREKLKKELSSKTASP